MIDILTCYKPKMPISNSTFCAHTSIGEISFKHSNEFISNEDIAQLYSKVSNIIKKYNIKNDYPSSQSARRYSISLNCKRHMSIFNRHNITPEFCFSCYKIQVEPKNVIDLIKLFLIFGNITLEGNNTRKCTMELRPKIPGFYKGLIYCSSLKEAYQIAKELGNLLKKTIDTELSAEVKRGYSEYSLSLPKYKKIGRSGIN